jgi:hypothetical protein
MMLFLYYFHRDVHASSITYAEESLFELLVTFTAVQSQYGESTVSRFRIRESSGLETKVNEHSYLV